MARLPNPGGDDGSWGNILNDFLAQAHNPDGTPKDVGVIAAKAEDTEVVHNSGNESVTGTKTFATPPKITAAPTTGTDATNKTYVDATVSAGAPDASNTTKGLTRLSVAALSPTNPVAAGDNDPRLSDPRDLKAPTADVSFNSRNAINLADPTAAQDAATKNYVDSQVIGGTTPDATTTTKGKLQLAGDLAGTAAAPTVPGLAAKADDSTVVHKAGTETITGAKDFTGGATINGTNIIVASDTRLTDARTPTGTAGGVLNGTYPNPGFAADVATQAELDVVESAAAKLVGGNAFTGGRTSVMEA